MNRIVRSRVEKGERVNRIRESSSMSSVSATFRCLPDLERSARLGRGANLANLVAVAGEAREGAANDATGNAQDALADFHRQPCGRC